MSNFIFELLKYYFTGGVCLLFIYAFDVLPDYLWVFYLIYGFPMVSFTYMISLFFKDEASAQNFVILVNFLFGSLGGSVVIVLRILNDLVSIGKAVAYALRFIPSFAFAYGFNQLLSAPLLFLIDYPDDITARLNADVLSIKYAGADIIFLSAEFFVFLIILIIGEYYSNNTQFGEKENRPSLNGIDDSFVINEIEKANNSTHSNYSVRVKNLEKSFSTGLCSKNQVKAINKLSFCMEYGECFALLGVNGAGKTTTFKCLTSEIFPTKGKIFIDGLDLAQNFEKVRNLIGYCPQFDSMFDYMTVYENLDFYGRIRGIPEDKLYLIIDSLMAELNLIQYKDKVSANLR